MIKKPLASYLGIEYGNRSKSEGLMLLKGALMPWGCGQCESRGWFSSSVSCVTSFFGGAGQAPASSCTAGFLYKGPFLEGVKTFASCRM